MKRLLSIPFILLLSQCSPTPPVLVQPTTSLEQAEARMASPTAAPVADLAPAPTYSGGLQQVINVSAYDPKERHRSGRSYSQNDVSALKANGARGLIARIGKGGNLDTKCSSFIAAADRAGILAGVYYRVQRHTSITRQADQFVAACKGIQRRRGSKPLLLCGDYDGDLSVSAILTFMNRVEAKTGVVPVAYLENSQALKLATRAASSRQKAKLRRAPYWLALYAHDSGAGPVFPSPGNPRGLVKQYNVWRNWTMWQYGGVAWENRRSRPKVYSHGRYRFSRYFGNMDRPLERNVFRGSYSNLVSFWNRHGLK